MILSVALTANRSRLGVMFSIGVLSHASDVTTEPVLESILDIQQFKFHHGHRV